MNFLGSRQFKVFHGKRSPAGIVRRSTTIAGVRKQAIDKVEKLDDRTLRFTISTGALDRDMDTIAVAGWDLANFAKNPVVLWAHRADDPPIGKAIDFGTDSSRLFSSVRFLPSEYGSAGDFAEMIYRMACDGWLGATSVGFRPISWDFTDDKERGGNDFFPGIDFREQELVELSIVSVPSNPEALIEAETIMPGDDSQSSANVISPAPVQVISYDAERRKRELRSRRARAAMLGVF